jgi:hypothetical protein
MTGTGIAGPYQSPKPQLLAERARGAARSGRCAFCGGTYRRGDRIADLAARSAVVHAGCAARAAGVTR